MSDMDAKVEDTVLKRSSRELFANVPAHATAGIIFAILFMQTDVNFVKNVAMVATIFFTVAVFILFFSGCVKAYTEHVEKKKVTFSK